MSKLTILRASAGSGKTFQITGTFLQLLFQNPYNYRHVLAVTFTNKATEEMKGRIVEQLHKLATGQASPHYGDISASFDLGPGQVQEKARFILSLILHDYAGFSVFTIDRFFQKIIHAFLKEIGLQGGFRVELDNAVLVAKAVEKIFMELHENEKLKDWIITFSQNRLLENRSWKIEKELTRFGQQLFDENLQLLGFTYLEKLSDKEKLEHFIQQLHELCKTFETRMEEIADKALQQIADNQFSINDFKYKATGPAGYFINIKDKKKYEPGKRVLEAIEDESSWIAGDKKGKGTSQPTLVHTLMERAREALEFFQEQKLTYYTAREILKNYHALGLLSDISSRLRDYVNEENILPLADTNRIIHEVTRDTEAPFIYEKVGTRYQHFMIDEFQDTSRMQWFNFKPLVLNSLSQDNLSMIVGDVKQSIYRWRNSDWGLLAGEVEHEFAQMGTSVQALGHNWRSKKEIIDGNNHFFKAAREIMQTSLFQERTPGLAPGKEINLDSAYADHVQKYPAKEGIEGGYMNFRLYPGKEDKETRVMEEVKNILGGLFDAGYQPGDIAFLIRKNKEGQFLSRYLLDIRPAFPGQEYEVISDDSLFVSQSPAVQFVIGILKYLHDPVNKINQAFLVNEYHDYLARDESPGGQNDRFTRVGEGQAGDFFEWLDNMEQQSLFEMVEEIIRRYQLNYLADEMSYLVTFQDLILKFTRDNPPDIGNFLEWWEESGKNKSIPLSLNENAIRVLTIHKAKGLEFKVVVCPFLDWPLGPTHNRGASIQWMDTSTTPFREYERLPISLTKALENTYFHDQYQEEILKTYVDNLNLLYVAFTRAEEALYGLAPVPEKEGQLSTVAHLVHGALDQLAKPGEGEGQAFQQEIKGDMLVYTRGRPGPVGALAKGNGKHLVSLTSMPTSDFKERLQIKYNGLEYFNQEAPAFQKMNHGKLMHEIFSKLEVASDLDKVLARFQLEGKLTREQLPGFKEKIAAYLQSPLAKDWFAGGWGTRNEASIILPGGRQQRPDRVIYKDHKAIVIDYKFGESEDIAHIRQVTSYKNQLEAMGYQPVEGYIWYVEHEKVVTV
jgi:ATP-dependent exoDNAse (exonuclease V) beta subunit